MEKGDGMPGRVLGIPVFQDFRLVLYAEGTILYSVAV